MKKKLVVLLLSKAGGGKDTQGEFLVRNYGFSVINSGAILRNLKDKKILSKFKKGTTNYYEIKEIQKIMNSGKFVPTLTVVSRWLTPILDIVRDPKKIKGVVFTGSPRKLMEAILIREFFQNWPDAAKNFQVRVIGIKISDKEVFRRVSTRRQCENCGKIFSASRQDSALEACDVCGGGLIKRKDDNKAVITSRLQEFRDYVIPVLKYFKKEEMLKIVNGEQSVEKVHEDIVKAIGL